jgi:hypothetical protein
LGKNVFANGREVSASKDDNQVIAAMPDVCLSPPSPPAGPIPIPYPVFAKASDTDDGTRDVQIGGDGIGIKSDSNFKQCNGDEAATKSFGMNVGSGCIQGKTVAQAWSFDVKFEGKNALRLMDLTISNNS